jgi:hypothetical protein
MAAFGAAGGANKRFADHRTAVMAIRYPATSSAEEFDVQKVSEQSVTLDGIPSRARTHRAMVPPARSHTSDEEIVHDIGRLLAEGRHLADHIDDLDGPLFIDGSLYPIGAASRMRFTEERDIAPANDWETAVVSVFEQFVQALNSHLANGHPVFSVAKDVDSNAVVESLTQTAKADTVTTDAWFPGTDDETIQTIPWTTDTVFFQSLLSPPLENAQRNRIWHYTPWLSQPKITAGGTTTHPLAGLDLEYEDMNKLSRVYFYVRIPNKNVVVRVETAQVVLDGKDTTERKQLQKHLISEMANDRDTAAAIKRADGNAKFHPEWREQVIRTLENELADAGGGQYVPKYNGDLRWQGLYE